MPRYLRNILVALTQLLAQVIGISYNPNETTSGAAYRRRYEGYGWLYKTINAIFFWQDNHCKQAALSEILDCQELLEEYDALVRVPKI